MWHKADYTVRVQHKGIELPNIFKLTLGNLATALFISLEWVWKDRAGTLGPLKSSQLVGCESWISPPLIKLPLNGVNIFPLVILVWQCHGWLTFPGQALFEAAYSYLSHAPYPCSTSLEAWDQGSFFTLGWLQWPGSSQKSPTTRWFPLCCWLLGCTCVHTGHSLWHNLDLFFPSIPDAVDAFKFPISQACWAIISVCIHVLFFLWSFLAWLWVFFLTRLI